MKTAESVLSRLESLAGPGISTGVIVGRKQLSGLIAAIRRYRAELGAASTLSTQPLQYLHDARCALTEGDSLLVGEEPR